MSGANNRAPDCDSGCRGFKPRFSPHYTPYFAKGSDLVDDYMESYEIFLNQERLQKEMQDSLDSGLSDLKI